jgi:hypothetical protein
MRTRLDEANAALIDNDFDKAIAILDEIAAASSNADERAAATALADLARRLKASGAVISLGGPEKDKVLGAKDKDTGRTSLVITTTLASFYSSFALVDVLGIDGYTPITISVATTTALGLGTSLYLTRDRQIHPATASAYSTGLIAGVANGLLLAERLGIHAEGEIGDGDVNQSFLLFGLTTMALGGATGYWLAEEYEPTEGQVTTTSMAGVSGFASAGLMMAIIQPDNLEADTILSLLALGMDTGLAGGALLTRDIDWSPSRANYVALSQFLGALAGFTVGAIAVGEPDNDTDGRIYGGLVLGGIWTGLAGGIYFTRDMDPDTSPRAPGHERLSLVPMLGKDMQGVGFGGSF